MTQFIDYFNYLWETIMTNVSGVYNYFTEPNDLKSDLKTNIKNKVIQMEKLNIEKDTVNFKNKLEFILSEKLPEDITDYDLIQRINTEIQYINKKMSMVKGVAEVNIEDIMTKTKLINLLKQVEDKHFFIEQVIEIMND
jgi:hypothetical protein